MAAFAYASVSVSSRLGLQYSTPLTATCVAMAVRMTLLWCAVLATGGVPAVARLALPVFFAAVLATVAAVCLAVSMSAGGTRERIAWDRRALLPFVVAGAFETVASLFSLIAVSMGQVVAVAPLVATSSLWTQVLTRCSCAAWNDSTSGRSPAPSRWWPAPSRSSRPAECAAGNTSP